ncbi:MULTISPECIES: ABC transporter ATP-binding protein [unclassified Spirillospora]|uniref:ABC transporter ATP-binding protein n=1 Tax=unclassified Spirillospora TaxID=2642701 RepID=UPI00371FE43C
MTALLEARGLGVRFGGVQALTDVDLTVDEGALVGLIGPNGAGKTTLIDALTGLVPADGRITFAGRRIGGLPAHRRARAGLGRTWQSLELFGDLTVAENLQVAADRQGPGGMLLDLLRPRRTAPPPGVAEALALLELDDLADRMPDELTQGQRKLVGVARALAARPRLVCLDEPAAGLDTGESAALGRHLRRVAAAGTSMLLVDHDMGLVFSICDLVYVLEFGRVITAGAPAVVRADRAVITAYLGGEGP